MSDVFIDKRSPEARRYRTIRIHVYYLARVHRDWLRYRHAPPSIKVESLLKAAASILQEKSHLSSFDKLALIGLLYGKTKSEAGLAEAITYHAQTQGRKLLFQFVAEEIENPSRQEKYIGTPRERYVRLSQIFQITLARKLLNESYAQKITELNDQEPERTIYLAATINTGHNPIQHPFSQLCLNLLARAAHRFSSDQDALRFIQIARAGMQGAQDGNSSWMLSKISRIAADIFIMRLKDSPQAKWTASKKLCDTSEALKNVIPAAVETFGPRDPIWRALSPDLRVKYRLI